MRETDGHRDALPQAESTTCTPYYAVRFPCAQGAQKVAESLQGRASATMPTTTLGNMVLGRVGVQ